MYKAIITDHGRRKSHLFTTWLAAKSYSEMYVDSVPSAVVGVWHFDERKAMVTKEGTVRV